MRNALVRFEREFVRQPRQCLLELRLSPLAQLWFAGRRLCQQLKRDRRRLAVPVHVGVGVGCVLQQLRHLQRAARIGVVQQQLHPRVGNRRLHALAQRIFDYDCSVAARPSGQQPAPDEPEPQRAPTPVPPPTSEPAPLLVEDAPPPIPDQEAAAPSDAPYDAAPVAPTDFAFDDRSLTDLSAEADIRAELPPVRVSEAETLTPDETTDSVAEVENAPDPEPKAPPPQPGVARIDSPPRPDTPDTPPAPEPEPEPQLAEKEAPDRAETPNRRPRRPQPEEQVAQKPEEDEKSDQEWLSAAAAAVAQHQQTRQASPTRATRAARGDRPITPLSASEKDGLRFALRKCWARPDIGRVDPRSLIITLRVELDRNGWILGEPTLLEPTGRLTLKQDSFYRSARGALQRCQPFNSLPQEKYDAWARLIIDFDPLNDSANIQ